MRRRPEDYGLLPDGDADFRWQTCTDLPGRPRQPRERYLSASGKCCDCARFGRSRSRSALGQLVSSTNLFHYPAALIEYELSVWLAASAAGALWRWATSSDVRVSVLSETAYDKKLLAGALFLRSDVRSVGALAMINSTYFGISWGLIPLPVFVLGFGLGFGASIPLRLSILADYFRPSQLRFDSRHSEFGERGVRHR